jgi:hypothetical protein
MPKPRIAGLFYCALFVANLVATLIQLLDNLSLIFLGFRSCYSYRLAEFPKTGPDPSFLSLQLTQLRKRPPIAACNPELNLRYSLDKNRRVMIVTACAGDVSAVSMLNGASSHSSYS